MDSSIFLTSSGGCKFGSSPLSSSMLIFFGKSTEQFLNPMFTFFYSRTEISLHGIACGLFSEKKILGL